MFACEVFARYAERFRGEALSAEVLHHAKRAVIDWYASLYPGLDAPAVQALEAVLPTIWTAARPASRSAAHATPRLLR